MRPLAEFPFDARQLIAGVLTDIDDTLTTDGRLTAAAYAAMERLHAAGLMVIPVTGRPAGWCDHIARLWPVDAVVGENGAFWMRYDTQHHRLRSVHVAPAAGQHERRERLVQLGREILAAVPGCALASDQPWRSADLAIDYCEDVTPLPRAAVDSIVAHMQAAGLTVKVSSIHVNGWFGDYDKLSTSRRLLAEEFGQDIDGDRDRARWVFVGDSPNDEPMFAHFPHSVGVANVAQYANRIRSMPAWITPSHCGAGFVELADALLV